VAASTGPDLTPLHRGDHVLYYLTSGTESGFPTELALRAPAHATADKSFGVRAFAFDSAGKRSPAGGVTVRGGDSPVTTNSNGRATVTVGSAGRAHLRAAKGDDIPSSRETVKVS
jgi:hypothetical protein